MVKKIAATAAAVGVILASAMPALANGGYWGGSSDDLLIKIKNSNTNVTNNVKTKANSGKNTIVAGDDVDGGKIKTGLAAATSTVLNTVNWNEVDLCGCLGLGGLDDVTVKIKNSNTNVTNNVKTKANSGKNTIVAGDDVDGGKIKTGGATSDGLVSNVVNTNVVGGSVDEE